MTELFQIGIKEEWLLVYWVVRTHGLIAMEFKDLNEAARVFKKLNNFCRVYAQPNH